MPIPRAPWKWKLTLKYFLKHYQKSCFEFLNDLHCSKFPGCAHNHKDKWGIRTAMWITKLQHDISILFGMSHLKPEKRKRTRKDRATWKTIYQIKHKEFVYIGFQVKYYMIWMFENPLVMDHLDSTTQLIISSGLQHNHWFSTLAAWENHLSLVVFSLF